MLNQSTNLIVIRSLLLLSIVFGNSKLLYSQSNLDLVWAKSILFSAMETDKYGNLIVAGSFDDSIDLAIIGDKYLIKNTAPVRNINGRNVKPGAMYLVKYNNRGEIVFANLFSATGAKALKLKQGINEEIFIAGTYLSSGDFDPGPGTTELSVPADANRASTFMLQLNATGGLVSARTLVHDVAQIVDFDGFGNIYVAGVTSKPIEFLGESGNYSVTPRSKYSLSYFGKFDLKGNKIYTETWSSQVIRIEKLMVEPDGTVIVAGNQNESFDVGIQGEKHKLKQKDKSTNAFIVKYKGSGELQFAHNFPISNARSLGSDPGGNIYFSINLSRGQADLDPGEKVHLFPEDKTIETSTTHLIKFDREGNYRYAMTLIGTMHECIGDEKGNLFIAGGIHNNVDLDPGPGKKMIFYNTGGFYIGKYDSTGKYLFGEQLRREKEFSRNALIPGGVLYDLQLDGDKNLVVNTGGYLLKYNQKGRVDDSKQLLSKKDIAAYSHTSIPEMEDIVALLIESGTDMRQEMIEGKHIRNTLHPASKVFSLGVFSTDSLINGKALIAFTGKADSSKLEGFYFGDMKNGLADGYGVFNGNLIYKEGFWKNGELIRSRQATEIFETIAAALDYHHLLEYSNVTDIRTKIDAIIFPRDMFNRALENGYKIMGSISFKSNNAEHHIYINVTKPDFYRDQDVILMSGDEESAKRFNKNKGNGYWEEIAKLWMRIGTRFMDPGAGSIDEIRRKNQEDLADFLTGKKLPARSQPASSDDYQAVVKAILGRCSSTDKHQFDPSDSIAGIWYDRLINALIYIPSKELGLISIVSLGKENLFKGGGQSMTDGAFKRKGRLTNKGWDIYGMEKDGYGGYKRFQYKAEIQKISRKTITFADGRSWERVNP